MQGKCGTSSAAAATPCGDRLRRSDPTLITSAERGGGTGGTEVPTVACTQAAKRASGSPVGDRSDPVSFSVAAAAELVGEYARLRRSSPLPRRDSSGFKVLCRPPHGYLAGQGRTRIRAGAAAGCGGTAPAHGEPAGLPARRAATNVGAGSPEGRPGPRESVFLSANDVPFLDVRISCNFWVRSAVRSVRFCVSGISRAERLAIFSNILIPNRLRLDTLCSFFQA